MDIIKFCRELPKIDLHAHLNGSLSRSTMLQLKRLYADSGISDNTNAFFDEFQIGAGDSRNLTDCFQVFNIAHSLTTTSEALALATTLTLQEFCEDGCFYLELRSTPRNTEYMNKEQYIDTIVLCMQKSANELPMLSRFIISINRGYPVSEADAITDLAIKSFKKYPDVVVGIELSGNPTVGNFQDFVPALTRARNAGLKITLHCGEVNNPKEVLEMLKFKPDRIGHGTCIHPRLGGSDDTWSELCNSKIPVEVCLTSNVNTKLNPDYDSHHVKDLIEAGIPVIICTDDKGVFMTSLSQEYRICAEVLNLDQEKLARLAYNTCQHVFDGDVRETIETKILNFIIDKKTFMEV